MSTLLVGKSDESYLIKCAQEQKFTYGIIIGHQAEPDKIVVVHLAKNNEEDVDVVDFHETLKIEDIDSQALTNQWMSAYKMCPGSFAVMGIFVTAERASIIDEKTDEFKNAKKLLNSIHQMLYSTNNNYCGALDYDSYPNLIFLAYSVQAREAICKSYTHSDNGGTFSPMQVRFVEKPFEWHIIECTYELDDIYPITQAAQDTDKGINVEVQFQKSIARIRDSLADSEIFLQQEHVDDNQLLVDYHKEQLQIQKRRGEDQQRKSYVATILVPLTKPVPQPSTPPQSNSSSGAAIKAHNGTIRYRGIISSRIWCNPRNTLAHVKSFIRNDVVRSLAARIQMYCDGLTEPFINSQTAYLSEPPRRVYFELPHATASTTTIQFSDYIFRGESATVAVAQAKQILDIDVQSEAIVANLEGLPDDNLYMNGGDGCDDEGNSEKNGKQHGKQQPMSVARYYFLGIGAAFLMLCMAIAAQLWLR